MLQMAHTKTKCIYAKYFLMLQMAQTNTISEIERPAKIKHRIYRHTVLNVGTCQIPRETVLHVHIKR